MRRKPLESLGTMVRERRGKRTLREAAREIGIGPATLLRIESGRIPDVATFGKVCEWMEIDPAVFLGAPKVPGSVGEPGAAVISAHFRADQTPKPETIQALAQMLLFTLRAQQSLAPLPNEHA